MLRLFKTVLLYLSMLTLPAQGYAASTMLFCGPGHQHTHTAKAADHHSMHGAVNNFAADHQYQAQSVGSLHAVGHVFSGEEVNFTGSDRSLATDGEPGSHESREHAACSVGAAIAASSVRLQPAEHAIERIGSKQFVSTGFVTDGPRRPPRFFPA